MGDDNLMDVNLTDLDLNQEPPRDPPSARVARYGTLLNDLETAHDRIEERIQQLEAVTARARQRQRWRDSRNSMEAIYSPGATVVNVDEMVGINVNNNTSTEQRTAGCKRDSSHLVAKALAMDSSGVKKSDSNKDSGGSFYDCNICLELAREPVLTCCGHLFCWVCFYQISYVDSTSKECPVCKGEVSDGTVIPIYGNGGSERVFESESGLSIPPRPKARRVESVRQQRLSRGLSHVPVAEALRRIRISIGEMGSQTQQGSGNLDNTASQEGQNGESTGNGNPRVRIHQVSRVLSESAASLTSLSSALSNAERLVEDLETAINSRFLRNGPRASSGDVENPFTRNSDVLVQPNNVQVQDSSAGGVTNGVVLPTTTTTPAQSNDVLVHALANAPAFRRRSSIISRTRYLEGRDSREPRRRRLN